MQFLLAVSHIFVTWYCCSTASFLLVLKNIYFNFTCLFGYLLHEFEFIFHKLLMLFFCKLIWKCLLSNTGRMCCFKGQKAEHSTGHKKTGEFFCYTYFIWTWHSLFLCFVSEQSIASGPVFYPATPPTHLSNMPIDQFAAVYPQGESFLV